MFRKVMHTPETKGIVLLFVGRDCSADSFLDFYKNESAHLLTQTRFIAIEPSDEWYPAPNGANNQEEALEGIQKTIGDLKRLILDIQDEFHVPRSEIALVGYSAGAVMALRMATVWSDPFAAIVSHNGAILDPLNLEEAINETPIILFHAQNDDCFSWEERYLPTKNALWDKKYNLEVFESYEGGHSLSSRDVKNSKILLSEYFDY